MRGKYKMVIVAAVATLCAACGSGDDTVTATSSPGVVTSSAVSTTTVTVTKTVPASTTPSRPATTPPTSQPLSSEPFLLGFIDLRPESTRANEPASCGSALVMVSNPPSRPYRSKVQVAMESLLSNPLYMLGDSGLVNPLEPSDMRYVSSSVRGDSIAVELTGTVVSRDNCSNQQILAQLTRTAAAAAGVSSATITLDGTPIGQLMPY